MPQAKTKKKLHNDTTSHTVCWRRRGIRPQRDSSCSK